MEKIKNKKAISGLVIVVLLVAIAVALSAMFIGWVSSLTGQQMDTMKSSAAKLEVCRKVLFEITKVEVLKNNNNESLPPVVRLYVTNQGSAFDGFRARFLGKTKETNWIDAYFTNGKLEGNLAKDTIEWNLSAYITDPNENVTYTDLVSMEFVPLVNVTVPVRETLICDNSVYRRDLTYDKQ